MPSLLLSFQKCLGAQRRLYFCCSGCQESLKVLICKEKKFFFNKKRLSFDGLGREAHQSQPCQHACQW